MPTEYAVMILAVAALFTGGLYLMTRRRHRKKKSAPPVRPAAPTNQTAGVAATWAPPAQPRPATVAPTMVAPPPSNAWGPPPTSGPPAQAGWGTPASPPVAAPSSSSPAPAWGSPPSPPARGGGGGPRRPPCAAGSGDGGLGRARCVGATARDGRAFVGRIGRDRVGRAEDRRACSARGTVVDGPFGADGAARNAAPRAS